MRTDKAIAVGVLVGAGVWWLAGRRRAMRAGLLAPGPMVGAPINPMLPGNPSTVASQGDGQTNPLLMPYYGPTSARKGPGNTPWRGAEIAAPGTPLNPVSPPDLPTKTFQPERPLFVPKGVRYLPNLGDANYSAWSYLAVTPPDLCWGLRG